MRLGVVESHTGGSLHPASLASPAIGRDARFRWGIFGTGAISTKFAAGLKAARSAELAFVASRSLEKAQAFAAATGTARAIGGYAEAAAAGGVDAVYIATPPSEHAAHALLCIEAGIPVLIEKPFALHAADAARIVQAARARRVFAMEAMWTRFLPAAGALRDRLAQRPIGEVRLVTGSFGTSQIPDPAGSMFDPLLGGGAVSHLGAYPVSLAQWLFGPPVLVQAAGRVGATGVDEDAAFQLQFADGVTGSFFVSLRAWAANDFQILGTDGQLSMEGAVVRPFGLRWSREAPRAVETASFGAGARLRQNPVVHLIAQILGQTGRARPQLARHFYAGNGYHYEADEVRTRLEDGALESPVMPLDDSVAVVGTLDAIRSAVHQAAQNNGLSR